MIHLSEEIKAGVDERMSFVEKSWLGANIGKRAAEKGMGVTILKDSRKEPANDNVTKVDITPETERKSDWLGRAFSKPDGNHDSSGEPYDKTTNKNLQYKKPAFELVA